MIVETLNTAEKISSLSTIEGSDPGVDVSEDEELRGALDMHQLIYQQGPLSDSPPQTADQVIEEIDQMLQSCDFTGSMMTDRTMESVDSMYSSMRSPLPSAQSELDAKFRQATAITANPEYLQSLSYSKLVTLNAEMEQLIQVYNDSLVEQLAHRDELEYEKEMKNTFISLLLSIQNRRRQFANERKRKALKIDSSQLPQYMTASIPYDETHQNMDNNTLQALIKLLRAIDDDNPAVPSMLTDYILTGEYH
ncbi:unnamed protein product [Anisakis simplex]|uniref:Fasciculation and elongation protein zeta-2-like n=1 Tax=Anisakis simplex TaxID=6269 RepID=A0A0M3J0F5_ANISI|nr:unnamed protein product [Anisakis simplex]